ncbi:MAG: VTT domain-containing protein [Propionibacteriaceae bacterium]|nr:VTT domain-containing protein [Propionibacteriaceae bacterium]
MFVIVFCRAGGTYLLGRAAAAGASRRPRIATLMMSERYQRATQRVNDYGAPVVALSFLTIGFQTLANLAAGASRMPAARYLPALVVGGVLWALLYSAIGVAGVDLFGRLFERSPALAIGAAVAIIGGYAGFITWHVRRQRTQG